MSEVDEFSNDEILINILERVIDLKLNSNEDSLQELNTILDKLNARNQNFSDFKNVNKLISLICETLQPSGNEHLLSKFYHFLYILRLKEQVPFSDESIGLLVDYSFRSLTVCREWVLLEILNVLSLLLYENVSILSKYWDLLVGADGLLIRTFKRSQYETEIHLGTLKCLQNICLRKNMDSYLTEDHLVPCFLTFYETIKKTFDLPYDPRNILRTKTLLAALYGLKNIIIGWKSVPSSYLGELLGIMKCLISFGMKDIESPFKFSCLYPTNIEVSLPQASNTKSVANTIQQEKSSNKKRNRKKRPNTTKRGEKTVTENFTTEENVEPKNMHESYETSSSNVFNRLPWMYSSSSDSEYSDSERSHNVKINHNQAKVRYCSFKVMQAINWATDKKIMFGYFPSFIPDYPTQYEKFSEDNSILLTILKDNSPQVRGAALNFLTDLLDGTKIYLAVADERSFGIKANTSFIPKSLTLAGTIRELHKCLSLALSKEVSSTLLAQTLKCFSILVDNCSYHRLASGLLENAIKEIDKILLNKDVQVQVACWTFIGSLSRINDASQNLETFFCFGVSGSKPNEETECWLISHCNALIIQHRDSRKLPTPVLLEVLQVLTSFIPNFYIKAKVHLNLILEIINYCVTHPDSSIQFHGVKVFESLCKCSLEERLNQKGNEDKILTNITESLNMWLGMLNGPFPCLLQHISNHSIRALCCDCLSNIGNDVFQKLPRHTQVLCVSVLLGLVRDENANVRGAAVRCLGIYTLYSSMNDTVTFLMDVGDVIKELLEDPNYNTCLKASWALGNLSDALLLKREEILEEFPSSFVCSLGNSALKASKTQDNIKIRANIVRAIGNLLNYIPDNSLGEPEMISFINEAVKLLLSCLGKSMMKVQWNVCYALGIVLQNKGLVRSKIFKLEDIFNALIATVNSTKNYKVKINAVSTLGSLNERNLYDDLFSSIWLCLLDSLVVIEESVDYREINHRDSLCIQLCISLAHITSLLTMNDILLLNDYIVNYENMMMKVVIKYSNNIPQEKVENIKCYKRNLEELQLFILNSNKQSACTCITILENFFHHLLSSGEI